MDGGYPFPGAMPRAYSFPQWGLTVKKSYSFLLMVAMYLLIATFLTYPLVCRLSTHLPLGTEPAATVPLFNLWTLLWNANRLATLYQGYWHAPIFFPTPGTFALSEPQPLTGLLFAPVFRATTGPVFAYNVVFLLHLTLNGISAFCLARTTGASLFTSFLAGVLAQTLPFVTNEWGVLQLTAVYPIFFTLAALLRWKHCPTVRNALALAIWFAAVFWTSVYYGLFLVLFSGLYGGLLFVDMIVAIANTGKKPVFREHITTGLFALGIIGLLLSPVMAGQLRYTAGYNRSNGTIRSNSAQPIDYLRLGSRVWGSRLPWLDREGGSGQRLYPGSGLLVLGIAGVIIGFRRDQHRWVFFAVLSIGIAFLLSLGLNWTIGEFQPYQWVREWIPGYRQLRSPFRLGLFVQIFLVSLAAFVLNALVLNKFPLHRAAGRLRRPPFYRALALVMVGLAIVEVLALPARLYAVPPTTFDAAWTEWLRTQPPGAAVTVPFAAGSRASDYEATVLGMLQGLSHRHPLANGYSGFFPERHDDLKSQMQTFPSSASITMLQTIGVRYVIIDREWEGLPSLLPWQPLIEQYRDAHVVIFTIETGSIIPP